MAQTTDAINFGDLQGFYDQHMQDVVQPNANKGIPSEAICSTAGGTAAKVTNTTPASFSLVSGAKIVVKFTYAITVANATLQVGESTAKPIYYKGAALGANLVQAGSSILLHYDGTSFNIVGDLNTDTTYSVMGASGSTHASGLVPDTPTTAGTTKFLREDGTWQEPAGSSYTAGDGIDITNNEISVDSTVALKTDLAPAKLGSGIGTCSTSSGTALTVSLTNYELVQNGFVAVTFENDVPAGATLNINGKGAKAIYYKGAAIDGDTIKADDTALFSYDGTNYVLISSGGSGSIPQEELTISLASNQTADTGLNGATITVTQTGVVEPLYSGTWAGTNIVMNIDAGIEYTITVGSVTGYATPATQTYSSLGNNSRTATFTYNTELVTVTCTKDDGGSVAGANVSVNGTSYTLDATGIITAKVAFGTSYSVVPADFGGYSSATQTFTANQVSRSVSVEYVDPYTVDMGFPSGTKWRKFCVGANSINDTPYGMTWGNGASDKGTLGGTNSNYASTIGGQLTAGFQSGNATYDMATAVLGAPWRTPTKEELQELIDRVSYPDVDTNTNYVTIKSNVNNNCIYIGRQGVYYGGFSIRSNDGNCYALYGNMASAWPGEAPQHKPMYYQCVAVK